MHEEGLPNVGGKRTCLLRGACSTLTSCLTSCERGVVETVSESVASTYPDALLARAAGAWEGDDGAEPVALGGLTADAAGPANRSAPHSAWRLGRSRLKWLRVADTVV